MRVRLLSTVALSTFVAIVLAGCTLPGSDGSSNPLATGGCRDRSVPLTVEETRLSRTLPGQKEPAAAIILRRSGFDHYAKVLAGALCGLADAPAATALMTSAGEELWRAAVSRSQQATPPGAEVLPADDDRPLYWARLAMTSELRQWSPSFQASPEERSGWQKALEYASRGITSARFDAGGGVRKLFVSGFDPFQLDSEIRRGNPSGAGALHLDGRTFTVGGTRVQVQAVIFPVRYADFDRGIVEDAFAPHLASGSQRADLVATTSQGSPGSYDLEVYNGRRRSSTNGDNNNVAGGGTLNTPVVPVGIGPGPEFIRTSLPVEAMRAIARPAYPVRVNLAVIEIPAGHTAISRRTNGPTVGSTASEGGGGGFLSNECAYRVTWLLTTLDNPPPGGHLHTPVLWLDAGNVADVTDPAFEEARTSMVAETQAILLAGVAAAR